MALYIPVDRHFLEIKSENWSESEEYDTELGHSPTGLLTWTDILVNRCTVVLANAGSGKTAELENQARVLRQEGRDAFFCRLELLSDQTLNAALQVGDPTDLAAWLKSTRPGYFFLDSVDEAKLLSVGRFEAAMIRFVDAITLAVDRVIVIVSARPNAWAAYTDRDMLVRRLGLRPRISIASDKTQQTTATAASSAAASVTINESSISIVRLLPLQPSQIRAFSVQAGVSDVDQFIEALERADAGLFAGRPSDLLGLIEVWRKTGRIGSYTDVVFGSIQRKLAEPNPAHQSSSISAEETLSGATVLAAAATLMRRTTIGIPGESIEAAFAATSIDPLELFLEWTPSDVKALLGSAIFDPALFGTVGLHVRPAREFLTARWFDELLRKRKNRRSIDSVLFTKPYGTEPDVVVGALKPIVGWLAARDESVRNRTLRIDPTVLLQFGDAAALDVGTRAELLRAFAERYKDRQRTPMTLNIREIRRLADARLSPVINELLRQYRKHHDVRNLLLRIIREGKISACTRLAANMAVDEQYPISTRIHAMRAVAAAGTPVELRQLAAQMLNEPASLDREIVAAAFDVFTKEALSISIVERVLRVLQKPEKFEAHSVVRAVSDYLETLEIDELRKLLRSLIDLLASEPWENNSYCQISSRYAWLLPVVVDAAVSLADRSDDDALSDDVLTAITMSWLERYLSGYTSGNRKKVEQILTSKERRHAVFWHEVKQMRSRSVDPIRHAWHIERNISVFQPDDFDLFETAMKERSDVDDQLIALDALLQIWRAAGQPSPMMKRIQEAVSGHSTLENALAEAMRPHARSREQIEFEAETKRLDDEHSKEEELRAQNRAQWIEQLKQNPAKVGDLSLASKGKILQGTVWIVQEMREKDPNGSRLGLSNWEGLQPEFSAPVIEAFKQYCRRFWRLTTPALRSEIGNDSTIPWSVIIGLIGLEAEDQADPLWAEKLTTKEVESATRYALRELNGLPHWFAKLHRAHPGVVEKLLTGEIDWELVHTRPEGSAGHILALLRYHATDVGAHLRERIVQSIQRLEVKDQRVLQDALTIILRDPRPLPESLIELAHQVSKQAPPDIAALWIAFLLCATATRGVDVLEQQLSDLDRKAGKNLASRVVGLIVGDRDYSFGPHYRDFVQPEPLTRLLVLSYKFIRARHGEFVPGIYSPGSVSDAPENRSRLLELLANIPGRQTYDALTRLSRLRRSEFPAVDTALMLAERRAEADTAGRTWSATDVYAFARTANREVRTEQALFEIAVSRLDDYRLDIEEGDESLASLLRKVDNEVELRRVIANHLRLVSLGNYTTGSEEELADATRTDIRLHNSNVSARVPIEIKIAGQWQASKLRERMRNQLYRQYMREAKHAIFLVVNRSSSRDLKSWAPTSAGRVQFPELMVYVQEWAAELKRRHSDIQALEVIGIDLTRRAAPGGIQAIKKPRSKRKRKAKPNLRTTNAKSRRRSGSAKAKRGTKTSTKK